jgi:hypothetical protein
MRQRTLEGRTAQETPAVLARKQSRRAAPIAPPPIANVTL